MKITGALIASNVAGKRGGAVSGQEVLKEAATIALFCKEKLFCGPLLYTYCRHSNRRRLDSRRNHRPIRMVFNFSLMHHTQIRNDITVFNAIQSEIYPGRCVVPSGLCTKLFTHPLRTVTRVPRRITGCRMRCRTRSYHEFSVITPFFAAGPFDELLLSIPFQKSIDCRTEERSCATTHPTLLTPVKLEHKQFFRKGPLKRSLWLPLRSCRNSSTAAGMQHRILLSKGAPSEATRHWNRVARSHLGDFLRW